MVGNEILNIIDVVWIEVLRSHALPITHLRRTTCLAMWGGWVAYIALSRPHFGHSSMGAAISTSSEEEAPWRSMAQKGRLS